LKQYVAEKRTVVNEVIQDMEKTLKECRENAELLASMCAANLTRLGGLFLRDGRFGDAREVLALAAKLGSLEALAEMDDYYARRGNRNRFRLAG
jgi:uncharacterized protein HemY